MYHMLLNAASVGFYLVAARSSEEHCEATAAVRRVHKDDSMADVADVFPRVLGFFPWPCLSSRVLTVLA